jgi:hypothetical protein
LALAAIIALSLHRLEISAPENPGVRVASLLAYSSICRFGSSFKGARWTMKISYLPSKSGKVTSIYLSNLPGLKRAASSNSGRFVAAIIITLESVVKPKYSYFTVHFNQELVKSGIPLLVPTPLSFLPYCIYFIDKNNARRFCFCLFKQIAHSLGSHPYKHFYEIWSRKIEERHFCLSSTSFCQ